VADAHVQAVRLKASAQASKLVLNTRLGRSRPERTGAAMKLTFDPLAASATPVLGDGDPLPPNDRVADRAPMLERLYRAQSPRLLRFFARRLSDQDANDLVNDAFVRFARTRAVNNGDVEDPEAFLQQVAKNVLRDRARAAFHRSVVDIDPDDRSARGGSDPVAALEARDMLGRMQRALDRLPAKTRAIFMAHRLDGATYAELADRYGLSVKGIEWHMSNAIARLHRAAGDR